jgi:hypothetical protein
LAKNCLRHVDNGLFFRQSSAESIFRPPMEKRMSSDSRELRWPGRKLAGDYVRGILGASFAAICILLAPAGSLWQIFLLALLCLFLAFLGDVLIRHGTRIVLTPDGLVQRGPLMGQIEVPWREITGLDVRFYPSGRDRSRGWMTATIKGRQAKIAIDDSISDFEYVLERAMRALETQGLELSEVTAANLASLGLGLRPGAAT